MKLHLCLCVSVIANTHSLCCQRVFPGSCFHRVAPPQDEKLLMIETGQHSGCLTCEEVNKLAASWDFLLLLSRDVLSADSPSLALCFPRLSASTGEEGEIPSWLS